MTNPTPTPLSRGLVWFRRDCRLYDHAALYHALRSCREVFCCFVLDTDILDPLRNATAGVDRRVDFLHGSLACLNEDLAHASHGRARLLVIHGKPQEAISALAQELKAQAVFANHDYEPSAIARDAQVRGILAAQGIAFHDYKDQVIFEAAEVQSPAAKPYMVFTPYKNMWLKKLAMRHGAFYLSSYPCEKYFASLGSSPDLSKHTLPSLNQLGFGSSNIAELGITPGSKGAQTLLDDFLTRMDQYGHAREFPAIKGPSYLSVHLRFGTVSIRHLAALAYQRHMNGSHGASVWLSELIWREFYFQILAHFPHVVHSSFKPAYDAITWEKGAQATAWFEAWCKGETGYPLVDAAMHQLNQTGYMHNRLRMVTACFLIKDLGIDWRWGEQYFALKLNDFDLAANNGGWQWAASTGCDAQPWFRIFNPLLQSEKFDPQGKFIRRYLPQLAALPDTSIHAPWLAGSMERLAAGVALGTHYPYPLVVHESARQATLARYAVVKQNHPPSPATNTHSR